MNRLRRLPFSKVLLLTLMVLMGCRNRGSLDGAVSADVATPSHPGRSSGDANWPTMDYSEVRAYYYRQAGTLMDSILDDSAIRRIATDEDGELLTADQTERLLTALTATHKQYEPLMCVNALHAFVFYDSSGHAVAAAEVGLECRSVILTPGGMQHKVDLPAVADLVDELGIPIHPSGTSAEEFRKGFEDIAADD
jgi:hypothetical protein